MKTIFTGLVLIIMVIPLLILAGCRDKNVKTTVRVMAAASMTEAFTEIKEQFEKKHPGIEVELNFAGSQKLAYQIRHGVYADVFASADSRYMEVLKAENLVEEPEIIANNMLIIAVYREVKGVKTMQDLTKTGVKLAIADIAVPAGNYTYKMLDKAEESEDFPAEFKQRFLQNLISKELNVKKVAAKVALGEADAGVVYVTDITPANKDKIKPVEIDEKYNVIAEYSAAVLENSAQKQAAQEFIDFIAGEKGRIILEKYRFILPDD